MLTKQDYNSILKLLESSKMSHKKITHIVGELKRITNFKRKRIIY